MVLSARARRSGESLRVGTLAVMTRVSSRLVTSALALFARLVHRIPQRLPHVDVELGDDGRGEDRLGGGLRDLVDPGVERLVDHLLDAVEVLGSHVVLLCSCPRDPLPPGAAGEWARSGVGCAASCGAEAVEPGLYGVDLVARRAVVRTA